MNNNSTQEEQERRQGRQDDIELILPFGAKVRASGKQVTAILVVVIGVCSVLYMVREHDLRSKSAGELIMAKQQETIDAVETVGYILTLDEQQRKGLKLDMPPKLRKQLLAQERNR